MSVFVEFFVMVKSVCITPCPRQSVSVDVSSLFLKKAMLLRGDPRMREGRGRKTGSTVSESC